MRKFFQEFKTFISRGNVVDMAVGVAVAGAFTKIVNAFTAGFITPLISLLSGDSNFAEGKWVIRPAVYVDAAGQVVDAATEGATLSVAEVSLLWGSFVQTIFDFLIIARALFVVMKTFNSLTARAKEMREDIVDGLTPARVKAEAEAKAQAEAEAKAQAEAEAAAKAEEEARIAAEKAEAAAKADAAQAETAKLLAEIRDLLAKKD